jgi:hypothetical protein
LVALGQTLTAHTLNESGDYEPTTESRCIPHLTVTDLTPTLTRRGETDENTLIRDFRAWVRALRCWFLSAEG